MIAHNKPSFEEEEAAAAARVIRSGYLSQGTEVQAFEEQLARCTERKYAVAVGSGFAALRLALLSLGIAPNDEVIIPAYCCVALPNAVLSLGAIPVAADVNEQNTIDEFSVAKVRSSRTKAILGIHTFGFPLDVASLRRFGLPIIEDCAHGFGLRTDAGIMGSAADIAICSFYSTKIIGCGEGGAVLTNKEEYAELVCDYRDYTDKAPSGLRFNDKMTNIEAAIAQVQLAKLPSFLKRRQALAERYFQHLQPLKEQKFLFLPDIEAKRIWYRYAVRVEMQSASELRRTLRRNDIFTEFPVESWLTEEHAHCEMAQNAYHNTLSLPLYPSLSLEDVDTVCLHLRRFFEENAQ